jgi:hypothetical protein
VLTMPEGYGKSHLVIDLVDKGFKVIFCAKSNAQLTEKAKEFAAPPYNLRVDRYLSKAYNLEREANDLGIQNFEIVHTKSRNPYGSTDVERTGTVANLDEAFRVHGVAEDASTFYHLHYEMHEAPELDAKTHDVLLVSFAAFQGIAAGERIPWWLRLGLVEKVLEYPDEESEEQDKMRKHCILFEKIALVIDDPDRTDLDWLREISEEDAADLQAKQASWVPSDLQKLEFKWRALTSNKFGQRIFALACQRLKKKKRPVQRYKIVEHGGKKYIERPVHTAFGYGLKSRKCSPKVIVTTTEWLTTLFAVDTLQRSALKVEMDTELFHTADCSVTAIATTLTRKDSHAVLLPIVEKIKEEFPNEPITFVADGLGCKMNLSSNKGRNDLAEHHTIIKLSCPHPSIISTLRAQLNDVENLDEEFLAAVHMADLGNQAIGRNQGFRFRSRRSILLVDPKYFRIIMQNRLLRYKLTPWSNQIGTIDNRYPRPPGFHTALLYEAEPSDMELRLIELMNDAEAFGHSEDAKRLANELLPSQRKHFTEWAKPAKTNSKRKKS